MTQMITEMWKASLVVVRDQSPQEFADLMWRVIYCH